MKGKAVSGILLSLLLVITLTLAFNIQTARSDGTQETDRPWYDMVNLKSNKIIDFNVISGEKFFEAKQNAGGEVKEDIISTVLYPNGEIYYYVEQTSQNGVVFYLRYFSGIAAGPTTVTVKVVDSLGYPVAGATVSIWDETIVAFEETDENGIAIIGTLDSDTTYLAKAEKDDLSGSTLFTTNSLGGADVTVEI